jgi:hypothetical protein
LSSVSGMVKNWGAWGSMAPPMTVDIMVVLLRRSRLGRARSRPVACTKSISQTPAQQGDT